MKKSKISKTLSNTGYIHRVRRYLDFLNRVEKDYRNGRSVPLPDYVYDTQEGQVDVFNWFKLELSEKQKKDLGRRLNTIAMLRGEMSNILEISSSVKHLEQLSSLLDQEPVDAQE